MQLRVLDRDPLDDGWIESELATHFSAPARVVTMQIGDTVLYRTAGKVTPAVLVESAGDRCWLARDARQTQGLIYLTAENITARLPRMDLLEEAA